uniref:Sulfhydryl oxidase n=1 Tax=Petromyzon marinus TaxID=7757 RepID=A0AAJ7U3J0_PETMA|nr:sulfhydryl oxidase 2-like [Petromyzon marinus]
MAPLLALLLLLLLGPLGPLSVSGGLYDRNDLVAVLGPGEVAPALRNSYAAWVVEFYASWCGHCIHFAPVWKALGADIKDWRQAVMLGVMDCAEQANQKTCQEFEVRYYPSIRFFPPFSNTTDVGKDHSDRERTVPGLRRKLVDFLEKQEAFGPSLAAVNEAEVDSLLKGMEGGPLAGGYLALVFEDDTSYVGREVVLDMFGYRPLVVRRVRASQEPGLVQRFSVTDLPSCILIRGEGGWERLAVAYQIRTFYTYALRQLPGVQRSAHESSQTPLPKPQGQLEADPEQPPWREFDSSSLYMSDLESALHYSLRVEVANHRILEGSALSALKDYAHVLAKLFPGRPAVRKLLETLHEWLEKLPLKRLPYDAVRDVINNKMQIPGVWLPEGVQWVACQGSHPHLRGYPCSMWTLFHVLTVEAARLQDQLPEPWGPVTVLSAMRAYVREFFGCRECAVHFELMARGVARSVKSWDEAVVWLWARHNQANRRLAGAKSEDPRFPKVQWPPPSLCPDCHSTQDGGEHAWDNSAVLRHLAKHYGRNNISPLYQRSPLSSSPPRPQQSHRDDQEWQQQVEADGVSHRHNQASPIRDDDVKEEEEEVAGQGEVVPSEEEADDRIDAVGRHTQAKPPRLHARDLGLRAEAGLAAVAVEGEGRMQTRRQRWAAMIGLGFSRVDISLCMLLYCMSASCLLGMYVFVHRRMKGRRGKCGGGGPRV